MNVINLLPIFLIGIAGSVHCVGMCGGIVTAFSASAPQRRFPVAVVVEHASLQAPTASDIVTHTIAYNAGRISSYAIAGALAGGMAGGVRTLSNVSILQTGGYWLANLMLIALGLYLMNAWRGVARLEAIGNIVWRRVQPLTRYLLPMDSPHKAILLGGLWGWLPCGMVYSVLLTAMLSGSAASGAAVMLAFGLGTLPMLFTLGMFGAHLKNWVQRRAIRITGGLLVIAFGVLGLVRASSGIAPHWLDSFCVTPPVASALQ